MGKKNRDQTFLQGGGVMGELIRANDWSKTPLGNPKTWPQPLKTMVSVMLDNPFGMYIAWGKDYTQIYNDGYRPILGATKHPKALGISTKETFAEVWNTIGSMFDGVMKGEAVGFPDFMLPLDRNGYIEKCYFDFAYSPIRLESGNVGGVLVTVIETTNKKNAEDELKESTKELEFVIEAAQLGTYDYNPLTNKFTANSRLKKWFGLPPEEQIELTAAINAIELKDKERVSNAIRKVLDYSSGGIYDVEYTIFNPISKKETIVHAKGRAWFNEEKIAYRLNGTVEDVTDRVLAREKIRESENNLRLMILQAPVAIAIFRGNDYRVEVANKFALQLWGRQEKQILNIPLFDAMPELLSQGIKDYLDGVMNNGKRFATFELPVQLLEKDSLETKYINFSYDALYDGDGKINGIMAIGINVTPHVESRKAVEESEEKLKLVIESSELGVFDVNLKTTEIVASNRCYEILGFSEKRKLTHEEIIKNLHPDDLNLRKKAYEKAFNTGSLNYQIRVIWDDQSLHWLHANGKVFYDASNEPERLLGTIRDITEERNFQQQLLEREEKFRLLADSMPQHIWTSDPEGNLNYFNQSVFDFSGLSLQQIKKEGWIQIVHPDDREVNIKHWSHAISTGEDFLLEHRFRKHNGEYRWQLSRAKPQRDTSGIIKMWVGTSTDIQEQKMFTSELESMVQLRTNELNQKNLDLEKMNKELQSFVYISSHDLQEPLRKIQTFASRIIEKEYATLSDNAKNYFSRMQKSASRMQNLIQDLVSYSRTNVQERTFENFDLGEIIKDTKETLSEEFEKKEITFKLKNICEIKIIPIQFKQVILNLVSNSIKFSKVDDPTVIEIDCELVVGKKTGVKAIHNNVDYCHIRFSDNGIGFEQHYSDRIFEVFQRLHSKDQYIGTGIGLAIVKRIIENHDGVILASSGQNQGATFDIYIPA